jgi:acid phosphatase
MNRRAFFRWLAAGAAVLGAVRPAQASGRWWSSLVFGVFENQGFTKVRSLPSHQRLAREGTVLARYSAITHPSGPNYRAMVSGEAWGRRETINTFHPSVASEAAAAVPSIPTYVYHLVGQIAGRHDPFTDLRAPIAAVRRGLPALRGDLERTLPPACLVYVGWDDNNDLHNGDAARADRNLTDLLDVLAGSPWFTRPDDAGRYPAFFFCYDEDDGREGNRVFATWWGRGVSQGRVSKVPHTHFGFCRTVTENWGLAPLGHGADEAPIAEPWV